ncbi:hypothetical protein BDZ88DRAFT_506042 [Geranomyces variabilis]|nr:hypothetical protein BDZ88DRAFT_506042 [Geranomyces variabilis]KAJ3137097.1 hypothetical protein HDU90_002268 [Geranomyces variabilis]
MPHNENKFKAKRKATSQEPATSLSALRLSKRRKTAAECPVLTSGADSPNVNYPDFWLRTPRGEFSLLRFAAWSKMYKTWSERTVREAAARELNILQTLKLGVSHTSWIERTLKKIANEDHWRLEEGELQGIGSKPARNDHAAATDAVLAGQKLDLRLTLKDTDAQLEALICLRSGGLPKATPSKIEGDRADLMNHLMETLWSYTSKVQGVPSEMLVDQFLLGLQSYDWESHL